MRDSFLKKSFNIESFFAEWFFSFWQSEEATSRLVKKTSLI